MATPPMTRPKHILHLFVTLPMGGAENLLLSILANLDPERYRSTVCCIRNKDLLGAEVMARGFPLVELGLLNKGGWDQRIVTQLKNLIRQHQIDLVHSHLFHANLYGRLAASGTKIPAIASIHNTYNDKRKWHRQLINYFLARRSTAIIAGSEEIKQDIVRFDRVDPTLIEIIPNAVDLSLSASTLSKQESRARLELTPENLVLGSVGRLEKQKGHYHLIEAMPQITAEHPQAILLLVGSGREETALQAQALALGVEKNIRFLGTRRDLGDLFRAMDLFVMPSLWEGLSLAMVSAMAAGLPIIATDVGGVGEVLAHGTCGRVVPAMNATALATEILHLVRHPQQATTLANLGKQRAWDHYSDRAMTRRVQSLYDRALEPTKSLT